jgi:hypothetical protein
MLDVEEKNGEEEQKIELVENLKLNKALLVLI